MDNVRISAITSKGLKLNIKYNVIALYILLGRLFLIPVLLLCGYHCSNRKKKVTYEKRLINEIDNIGLSD